MNCWKIRFALHYNNENKKCNDSIKNDNAVKKIKRFWFKATVLFLVACLTIIFFVIEFLRADF